MNSDRFGRLTEAQRDTLRLFHQLLQIKEIAQALAISESAVNQRLKQCREILGAPSSRAAAKWLAEHEDQAGTCSSSTYSFSTVVLPSILPPDHEATVMEPEDGIEGEDIGRDEGVAQPIPVAHQVPKRSIPWPFATAAAPENRLGVWTRLALVWPVAAFLMVAAMILALLLVGFQESLVSLQHHFVPGE